MENGIKLDSFITGQAQGTSNTAGKLKRTVAKTDCLGKNIKVNENTLHYVLE
jgi:hypothetical protein